MHPQGEPRRLGETGIRAQKVLLWHALAKKTHVGDSFLGYGITDKGEMLWEMSAEEEHYCKENGWKVAITFKPRIKFKSPMPIKTTPQKATRGKECSSTWSS